MIGDVIELKPEYYETAKALTALPALESVLALPRRKVILIAGESGSGKSVTAVCLQRVLAERQLHSAILHQDDYFKLPPASNDRRRRESLEWVGPGEVQLDLLQQQIGLFLAGAETLRKPLVDYPENQILQETLNLKGCDCLIIEGTYVMLLQQADFAIFMTRNYRDTVAQRLARGRELPDPFIERVLEIEHQLIAPMQLKAHALVDKNYQVATH